MFNALYSVWREVIYSCKSAFSFTSLPPTRRLSSSLSGVGWNMEWEHSIDIIDISSAQLGMLCHHYPGSGDIWGQAAPARLAHSGYSGH